jgi:hypothetical protein
MATKQESDATEPNAYALLAKRVARDYHRAALRAYRKAVRDLTTDAEVTELEAGRYLEEVGVTAPKAPNGK